MQSDYFTKALQGQAFHTHWKTLIGLDGKNDCTFYDKFKHPKISDDKLYARGCLNPIWTFLEVIYIYFFDC